VSDNFHISDEWHAVVNMAMNIFIYFTNGRYIECLSLTYATDKSKTQNKITLKRKEKKKKHLQ